MELLAEGVGAASATASSGQLVVGGMCRYAINLMYLAVVAIVVSPFDMQHFSRAA